MPSPQCVYCKSTSNSFSKVEHVIPRAFGTFDSDTMVLAGIVCDECNQYFGDNLEVYFNRSSLEALERFKHGLKPSRAAREIHTHRVASISASGPTKGMKFHPVSHELLPQVGFRLSGRNEDEREFFTLTELEKMAPLDKSKYDLKRHGGIKICATNEETLSRIYQQLARHSIAFTNPSEAPKIQSHQVELEYTVKVDVINFRTISKIAFNYLIAVRGDSFAHSQRFDSIRNFIRYGEHRGTNPVTPSNDPILALDTTTRRQTDGHIVVLESLRNGQTVQCKLALFNGVTYTIKLAENSKGIIFPSVGHHFDFRNRRISILGSTR